jgi:hypothetical protein
MDQSAQHRIPACLTEQDLRTLARYVVEELRQNAVAFTTTSAACTPTISDDVSAAVAARTAAKARGFFKVAEFAAVVGRHPQWVSDRCAAKVIKTLPGGKPWRIPLTEEDRWNKLAA